MIKYYNPPGLIFHPFAVEEIVNKREMNAIRNGCALDTLTSVDIQEIVRVGGKVIKIYEGVIYTENLNISPFRKNERKIVCVKTTI